MTERELMERALSLAEINQEISSGFGEITYPFEAMGGVQCTRVYFPRGSAFWLKSQIQPLQRLFSTTTLTAATSSFTTFTTSYSTFY